MVSKTRLSIQDYFNRAGIGGNHSAGRAAALAANSATGNGFLKILENLGSTVQKTDEPARGGMAISDYWQRPVLARLSVVDHVAPEREKETAGGDELSPVPEGPTVLPETDARAASPVMGTADLPDAGRTELSEADRISAGIQAAAAKYDLPAGLIHSVIRAESNFQPQALSRAGAQGLMQLMPATAEELGVKDPFDIEQNIDGGARYLRRMLDRFGGDLKQALAAYNAGPGTVTRYNGDVPYAETRKYVNKVLHYSRQFRV